MSFAEDLKSKKNQKIIEFAKEFLVDIRPQLIESAEKGYSAFKININLDNPTEKEKLHLYLNPLFISFLNEHLGGIKVNYHKEFIESVIFTGRGYYKYYLIFKWGMTQ